MCRDQQTQTKNRKQKDLHVVPVVIAADAQRRGEDKFIIHAQEAGALGDNIGADVQGLGILLGPGSNRTRDGINTVAQRSQVLIVPRQGA